MVNSLPRSIHPQLVIKRIPLHRQTPRLADEIDYILPAHRLGGGSARIVADSLFNHRAIQVVHPETEGDLGDLLAEHDPVGLDVGEVIEIKPAHGPGLEVVYAAAQLFGAEPVAYLLAQDLGAPPGERPEPRLLQFVESFGHGEGSDSGQVVD